MESGNTAFVRSHHGNKELGHVDMWRKRVPDNRNIKPKKKRCEQCSRMRTSKEASVAEYRVLAVEIVESEVGGIWIEGLIAHFKGPGFHSQ